MSNDRADLDPTRLRVELHSLSRHPPISVDDDAAFELQQIGLVTEILPWGGGTHRFTVTTEGKRSMADTAEDCKVPHCSCHRMTT